MEEALVSAAIRAIGNPMLKEAKLLLGAENTQTTLLQKMKEMNSLLRDADRNQHKSESVRNWLAEIRDLSYRAADATEALAVQSMLSPSSPSLVTKIKDITSRVEEINASMIAHGISKSIIDGSGADTEDQDWSRKTFPNFRMGDCFVGKEDQLSKLKSLVFDNKSDPIIVVWGMGGLGKTTIVKIVYNGAMIDAADDSFKAFAWVCITQKCEIRSVLEDVLKQLDPKEVEKVSNLCETELINNLCQIQRDNRCLIVIDDIWETSHWDGLTHAFSDQNSKSKILVTTRKKYVAEKIGLGMELVFLDKDDACELLKKKAFPGGNIPDFQHQRSIGLHVEQMVKKCGYLPFAICLLGGILRKKKLEDWESVNRNMDKYLAEEGKDKELDAVLKLSYDDLPYYLKPCFLYLGVLKEDESIHVGVLYRMWIAQGMILDESSQGNEEASLMDIAERYLSELASRSIVQVEVDDGVPMKKYKTCKLHDAVLKSCLSIGRSQDYCVQILEYEGGNFSAFLENALSCVKTRHLVIYCKKELEGDDVKLTRSGDKDNRSSLRSLHIRNDMNGTTHVEFASKVDFGKFKSLRSLAFERFKFAKGKLPKGMTGLVHLRYLCFRNCEIVDELPSSMKNLAFLETLDLFNSRNIRIRNDLKKVPRLKYLLLPHYDEGFRVDQLKFDKDFDALECLIDFNSSVHELDDATRMMKLQRFSAHVRDKASLSAILTAIEKWDKLVNSVVMVKMEESFESSEELVRAFECRNLYNLMINARVVALPTKFTRSNLASLILLECKILNDPMETLGNLPCLAELIFSTGSFDGEKMTCPASSFQSLRFLKLMGLPKLKQWKVDGGAMPLLSELHIYDCRYLEMVPDGLRGVSTLQKLIIGAMPEHFRKRVLKSGDDYEKVRHISTIVAPKNHVLTRSEHIQIEE